MTTPLSIRTVLVIGGGIAGLGAATALAHAGYHVEVLERRPYVGGRASSYEHPALGEVVDCQHVLLGCCTNLIHLYEQAGVADQIRWYDELTFLEPNGTASRIKPSGLPAPMHSTLSFLKARMLGLKDKLAIARGLLGFLTGIPADSNENVADWLKRTGQTERAIRHFWEPVLVGALNDEFELCSVRYAGQVFRESFLKSARGGQLGIPAVPLSDLYSAAARLIESQGGKVHLRENAEAIAREADGRWCVTTQNTSYRADAIVLALPFEQVQKLVLTLPDGPGVAALKAQMDQFVHSPISTLQLWFDREITDLDHAVLLDTTIQWMFHKSRIRGLAPEKGSYLELTISASKAQLQMERTEILENALQELALFFPKVKEAKLLKSGILKEARATFSVLPGLDAVRPKNESPWPGIFLAGDWTATDWPSTMEGAVRSGYLAAEAVSRAAGNAQKFLQPDLPSQGLMRLFE
ncbi:MAG: hydroxysqualene dehydroxylase HpnE [Acidobacteriaceae bacterium]